jgi:hypothetical protein
LIFQIKSLIIDYQPEIDPELKPGRVVRGTTQILVRLIKDKVWSIFCAAVSIVNVLYGHFVFVNPVAKKELSESGNFLFICVFISLCVCVFLSFCLLVFLSFCLLVFLSFYLFIFLSVCLFVHLSFSVFYSVCICVSVFLSLFVFLPFCLFVFLPFVFLSLC